MKKLISIMLALLMILTCAPAAFADEVPSVTVYLSVSKKTDFQVMNGRTMALQEITVPYFDLELYGLEDFYYNPDCYAGGSRETQSAGTAETAYGNITMLHLFIYATEVIYNGLSPSEAGKGWLADEGNWNGFSVSGTVGSSYCKFWNFGNNATYFLNYEYPLGRAEWGASCDQILLKSGDIVWARYNAHDPNGNGAYYFFNGHEDTWIMAEQGDTVGLILRSAASTDDQNGGDTYFIEITSPTNVYVTKGAAPTKHSDLAPVGQTDANGIFELDTSEMEPGTYYITTNTWDPAVAILYLSEAEKPAVIYGDLTGDGEVDVFDAAKAYSIANGKSSASDAQKTALDVNGDGEIDVFDAAIIYSYANGKRNNFPVENR